MNLLSLCPYWINPPTGGGPIRVLNITKELANYFKIKQFCFRPTLTHGIHIKSNKSIYYNYYQYQVFNPIILLSSFLLYKLNLPPDLLQGNILYYLSPKLKKEIISSDIIQIEHPWLIPFVKKVAPTKKTALMCHNFEADLFKQESTYIGKSSQMVFKYIKNIEYHALNLADYIFVCSKDDENRIKDYYKITREFYYAPNGVDVDYFRPPDKLEKMNAKKKLGLDNKFVIIFTGGIHKPNLEAIEFIKEIAGELSSFCTIIILGAAGTQYKNSYSDNLIFTGYVKDLRLYYFAADLAINPLSIGSGTSLKFAEYLSCGLPTISTNIGARGYEVIDGKHVLLCKRSNIVECIRLLYNNKNLRKTIGFEGRKLMVQKYSWKKIAKSIAQVYLNNLA
ncbi:hypothetical protein E308F_08880 [Moorella sp. E308F]|nr:hypothetical protein E308F_08880 [Moorella sp. E308F]